MFDLEALKKKKNQLITELENSSICLPGFEKMHPGI